MSNGSMCTFCYNHDEFSKTQEEELNSSRPVTFWRRDVLPRYGLPTSADTSISTYINANHINIFSKPNISDCSAGRGSGNCANSRIDAGSFVNDFEVFGCGAVFLP